MAFDCQCIKHNVFCFYLSFMLTCKTLSRVCSKRVLRESTLVDLIRNISLVLSHLNAVTQIVEPAIPFSLILSISLCISLSLSHTHIQTHTVSNDSSVVVNWCWSGVAVVWQGLIWQQSQLKGFYPAW